MAPLNFGKNDFHEKDISFELKRLFDEYNFDHIPSDQRMDLFKHRDLAHIKHYKAAVKIFGGPSKRTRAIVAPSMETPMKHRLGIYHNRNSYPEPPLLGSVLKPPPNFIKQITTEEKSRAEEIAKLTNYKTWISQRQKLRSNLESLRLTEASLFNKPNKTDLEKRVESKFRAERLWKPPTPPPIEKRETPKPDPDVPIVAIPPPDGVQILDKFLALNRMRLMDLFRVADKDKDWSLSRKEFLNAIAQSDVPIKKSEVDDIIIALDVNNDGQLSYQELNKGLKEWRKQRRNIKQNELQEAEKTKDGVNILQQQVADLINRKNSSRLSKVEHQMKVDEHSSHERRRSKTTDNYQRQKSSEIDKEKSKAERVNKRKEEMKPEASTSPTSKSNIGNKEEDCLNSLKEHNEISKPKSTISSNYSPTFNEYKGTREDEFLQVSPELRDLKNVERLGSPSPSVETDLDIDESLFRRLDSSRAESEKFTTEKEERFFPSQQRSKEEREQYSPATHVSRHSSNSMSPSSTPNTLLPPEADLREGSRAPESAEALMDMKKHDRVVLSRNSLRKTLSRKQRATFDEAPKVIKTGYKPIDDHCSESTLGGLGAESVNSFRQSALKEYYQMMRYCQNNGLEFTQQTLDRVLLYPGDRPISGIVKKLKVPYGPLTETSAQMSNPKTSKAYLSKKSSPDFHSKRSNSVRLSEMKHSGSANAKKRGSLRDKSSTSFVSVENVYPLAAEVSPKIYREKLSSGRAFVSRKIDNWMTFEEYNKYTEHLQMKAGQYRDRFSHLNRNRNLDATWPGEMDNIRVYDERPGKIFLNKGSEYEGICTGMYDGTGNALFSKTAQPKKAYPGYDNDLRTWPVGKYGVVFGNIDKHRIPVD